MRVQEFHRDGFDLLPRPRRFAPTTPGAFCFAVDDRYANKHAEDKGTESCPHGDRFNCNLAHKNRSALLDNLFGCCTLAISVHLQSKHLMKTRECQDRSCLGMLHRTL